MIPKILHYCWLSDEPIPSELQAYIDGWKKVMPDYQIKKWDKKAFDIHSVKWVEDAYNNRKWAFAADYIRAYALYTDGGFYLDSDVIVRGRFDKYLEYGFVTSIEYDHAAKRQMEEAITTNYTRKPDVPFVKGLGIQAAIMGSEPKHPFLRDVLSRYENESFINEDGTFNMTIAPVVYSWFLENRGFRYIDKFQHLDQNILICPSSVFAGYQTSTFRSLAVHMCAGSWTAKSNKKGIIQRLKKVLFIRQLVNLLHGSL